jgi:hypothetical protein
MLALAEIGSVASIEPLLPFATGLLVDRPLKNEAKEAIRRIQGRLPGAEGGQLSVAEVAMEQGRLSVTSVDGALSASEDEECD